jgi:caa(3)-type oxidase subunit IV
MTETRSASSPAHDDHAHQEHPYLTLFFILLNLTLMEYFYAKFHGQPILPIAMLVTAIGLNVITLLAQTFIGRFFPGLFPFNRKWVYLTVLPALILSFIPVNLVLGLVVLAVTKASLVGLYFMHLKYEGKWIYLLLLPTAFLMIMLPLALYPDIGTKPEDKRPEDEFEADYNFAGVSDPSSVLMPNHSDFRPLEPSTWTKI